MENVSLNNVQLDQLANSQPSLNPYFNGTIPCDHLPNSPDKRGPVGYIVNMDPQGPPRSTLDRPVDLRRRVRNHGQLRHTPGQLLDDVTVASLVGQALEILDEERPVYNCFTVRVAEITHCFFLIDRS